eukprot:gnl/TRDRNA2_/TRDRNA2_172243_c1_seq3.p1 gnl/TRDRNA2_/TRDRNA2_172243_c1~~gnl/TRDRNA2_/TRDRNA2_172243_c1_seq3.p1  ORF type:complete len:452 (+),score=31.31 gnl/TRDRNA2_/TRDRNA2_172243_c1_seq3:75-1358(+)
MVGNAGVLVPLVHEIITHKPGAFTVSTFSFAHTMATHGSMQGACLLTFYAVVIPVIKIALLILGEIGRLSIFPLRVSWARMSIFVVQAISKWASPDMFAYIIMCVLFRAVDSGPQPGFQPRIISDAVLDVGFTCYCTFCVFSTIASLAIKLPGVDSGTEAVSGELSGLPRNFLASMSIFAGFCFAGAIFFLSRGLFLPVMIVNTDLHHISSWPKSTDVPIATVESMLEKKLTIADCVCFLFSWTFERGELNSALALGMLAIFVVLFTVLDLFVLIVLLISCQFQMPRYKLVTPQTESKGKDAAASLGTLEVAHILKHLSMLDVAIMGIWLFTWCAAPYKDYGLSFSCGIGLLWLFFAEALHYITFYVVTSICQQSTQVMHEDPSAVMHPSAIMNPRRELWRGVTGDEQMQGSPRDFVVRGIDERSVV